MSDADVFAVLLVLFFGSEPGCGDAGGGSELLAVSERREEEVVTLEASGRHSSRARSVEEIEEERPRRIRSGSSAPGFSSGLTFLRRSLEWVSEQAHSPLTPLSIPSSFRNPQRRKSGGRGPGRCLRTRTSLGIGSWASPAPPAPPSRTDEAVSCDEEEEEVVRGFAAW